jgi:hypothetical protein
MTGRTRRAPAAVLAVLFVVSGCGMAKMQPAGEPPTSNLDELEHRLAKQEAVIHDRLGQSGAPHGQTLDELQGAQQVPAGGADQVTESAAPSPPEAASTPGQEFVEKSNEDTGSAGAPAAESSAAEGASAGSTCDLVCRALASMRRSADRICEIVGKEDPRCSQARGKVSDAARRVESAGCTCTGG